MKKIASFILLLLVSEFAFPQTETVPYVVGKFTEIAKLFESGTSHVEQISAINKSIEKIQFSAIPNGLIVREDNKETKEDIVDFFYHPKYIDELLKKGIVEKKAQELYKNYGKQKKGKCLYINVQSIKSRKTAHLAIKTKGETNIAIIAQPFGRIYTKFGDEINGMNTSLDMNAHKGSISCYKKYYHGNHYKILLEITNVTNRDISVTIISD